jgi:hypothetical protein
MAFPNIPKPEPSTLVILAVMLAIVLMARVMIDRPKARTPMASAILAGKAQARAFDAQAAEDGDLVDDEAAAGAMWAKSHAATDPSECPQYSAAFRKGCADYVSEQR